MEVGEALQVYETIISGAGCEGTNDGRHIVELDPTGLWCRQCGRVFEGNEARLFKDLALLKKDREQRMEMLKQLLEDAA